MEVEMDHGCCHQLFQLAIIPLDVMCLLKNPIPLVFIQLQFK